MAWFKPEDLPEPDEATLELRGFSVGAKDDRATVKNTLVTPLSSVCRLTSDPSYIATGVAIAPRVILTAGHNLISGPNGSIWTIDQAYNKVSKTARRRGVRELSHPRWATDRDPRFDIGLLISDLPLSHHFQPTPFSEATLDLPIYVVGYSEDFPNVQRFHPAAFRGVWETVVGHLCDTKPGQSGSPVFTYTPAGAALVAIHAYDYTQLSDRLPGPRNKAVSLHPFILDWVERTIAHLRQRNEI